MQLPPVNRSANWSPSGADLYSSGASGAVPVRPINSTGPVESTDYIGGGVVPRGVDKPSAQVVEPNRDWTIVRQKDTAEEPPEPPPEPISKQLIEFLQTIWRAASSAIVEANVEAAKASAAETQSVGQAQKTEITYADPKVKRSSRA